ncbi:GroES-like protein [Schizophyllum commune Tattone D]|nr:GroES-like protein [Schizophyllum commune Tattone D]
MVLTANHAIYDPTKVLKDPKFRVVPPGEKTPKDANIAAFYNPQHEVHLVEKPKPSPGPGQVLIHVRATGICGSDVHFWKHGGIGDMIVTDECGSGHESAGEVVEVGEGVTELKVRDRVALEVGIPCSQPNCEACRTGKYNACPDVIFCSTPPYHGTLTRYHVHPAQWCHKLPDNMSYEEGALCEPLAVVTGGVEKAGVGLGDPVLVTGAGPIGLVALLCARAAGAEPLVITDLFQSRLDFAKKLVPNARTILIDPKDTPKQNAERVKAAAGMPIKVTLECTGVETSIHSAIFATKFGGKVFIIGVGRAEQKFPFMHLSANEIDLGFLYRYANQYPKAIRLISGGIVDLKPLVTHRFPLEDAISAFQTASDPTQGAIKVQIRDE